MLSPPALAPSAPEASRTLSWWRTAWRAWTVWLLAALWSDFCLWGSVAATSPSSTNEAANTAASPAASRAAASPSTATPDDLLIVATVDGSLVGLSQSTGELFWRQPGNLSSSHPRGRTTNTASPVSEAPPLLTDPLVHTTTTIPTAKRAADPAWQTTAVPLLDGRVWLTDQDSHNNDGSSDSNDPNHNSKSEQQSGGVTLTTSLATLAARTPLVDARGRLYVGTQTSTTFGLDPRTGKIVQQVVPPSSPSPEPTDPKDPSHRENPASPPSSSDSSSSPTSTYDNLVWLGRIDRTVTLYEPRTGAVDVQVGAAEVLGWTDLVAATGGSSPGNDNDNAWLTTAAHPHSSGRLLATPDGTLAWQDNHGDLLEDNPVKHDPVIRWSMTLSTPAVYVVHAASGRSMPVTFVADMHAFQRTRRATSGFARTSTTLSNGDNDGTNYDQFTVVTALPNGQLYAVPLWSTSSTAPHRGSAATSAMASSLPAGHSLASSLPAAAAAKVEKKTGATGDTGSGTNIPGSSAAPTRSFSSLSTTSTAHNNHNSHRGKPLVKRSCQPGMAHFPGCLVTGYATTEPPPSWDGVWTVAPEASKPAGAVVPYHDQHYHTHQREAAQDHGDDNNDFAPPRYVWMDVEERNRRRFQRNLRVLGSWFFPVIALLFVLSFEMGRRKRQKENDHLWMDHQTDGKVSTKSTAPMATVTPSGVIQVMDDVILGYGGHGTVVFKGLLEGRQVAVKRMLKAYHGSADREISLLIESDGHPNVVRYFLKEVRGDFVYLALELCDLSLHELIGKVRAWSDPPSSLPLATRGILEQIAQGVKHLHGLRIVHRDLKPANILMARQSPTKLSKKHSLLAEEECCNDEKKNIDAAWVCRRFLRGHYIAKISDMGLGKQIAGQSSYGASTLADASLRGHSNDGGQSSIAGAGPGSVGWQAPEVMALRLPSDASMRSEDSGQIQDGVPEGSSLDLVAHARTSRSADIFSLGCIFYATLVPGAHPFGEWYEREVNIMHNRPTMDALKKQSPDAYDLVAAMVQRNPVDRPTANQVCDHPYFWSGERRLAFLCDVSDRIESEGTATDGNLSHSFVTMLLAMERRASEVVGTAWDLILDDSLVSNVQRFRTYDPSSVRDLLRLIRNKHHHYDELPETLKDKMGSNTTGLLRYFEEKFPLLLIHCYDAFRSMLQADDPLLQKYSIVPTSNASTNKILGNSTPLTPEVPSDPVTDVANVERHEPSPGSEEVESVENDTGQATIDDLNGPDTSMVKEKQDLDISRPAPAETKESTEMDNCTVFKSPTILQNEESSLWENNNLGNAIETANVFDKPEEIIVWECSAAAKTFQNRGWSRSDEEWIRRTDASLIKPNSNLVRCAEDPKFRTRLCNHWDVSMGTFCPMRKKNKCVFAHGPVELRVKDGKRNRWGKLVDKNGDNKNPKHSGGEDTYGAARSIETERRQEGKWNVNGQSKGKKGSSKRKG